MMNLTRTLEDKTDMVNWDQVYVFLATEVKLHHLPADRLQEAYLSLQRDGTFKHEGKQWFVAYHIDGKPQSASEVNG